MWTNQICKIFLQCFGIWSAFKFSHWYLTQHAYFNVPDYVFLTLRHFQRKCIFGHKHLFLESFRNRKKRSWSVVMAESSVWLLLKVFLNHKRPWNLPVCAKKLWLWVYKNTAILSCLKQLQNTIVISLKVIIWNLRKHDLSYEYMMSVGNSNWGQ